MRNKQDKIFDNNFEAPDTEGKGSINFDLDPAVRGNLSEEENIHYEILSKDIHELIENSRFKKFNEIDEFVNVTKLKKIANYFLKEEDKEIKDFCMMGFLSILEDVSLVRKHGSHYRFLNNDKSIGLQKLNIETIDNNADIFKIFKLALRQILDDIEATEGGPLKSPKIICGDSKSTKLNSNSIDLVITSPPYLNRNNYIAQQKAELDFLQMIDSKNEYKELS